MTRKTTQTTPPPQAQVKVSYRKIASKLQDGIDSSGLRLMIYEHSNSNNSTKAMLRPLVEYLKSKGIMVT